MSHQPEQTSHRLTGGGSEREAPVHFPVNHHLRPLYRALSLLAGLYVLIFGVAGVITTQGDPLYGAGDATALGLKTNPAFSYLSVIAGAVVVLATLIGRNVDRIAYLWVGTGFLVAGTVMLLLIGQADANVLNFTIVTCVVSYVIGSVLGTAGMYVKSHRA